MIFGNHKYLGQHEVSFCYIDNTSAFAYLLVEMPRKSKTPQGLSVSGEKEYEGIGGRAS